jgi:hypothetical protein
MNMPWLLVATLSTLFWLGFVFHTSSGPNLLLEKYSRTYLIFLALLTIVWLATLISTWSRRDRLGGYLDAALAPIAFTALLAALIIPPAYIYLHHQSLQRHVFAPLGPDAHAFFQLEKAPSPPAVPLREGLRVLTLGGSTTYGSRLDRSQTYPARLEELIRAEHPGRTIDVLNAGVPWHTSMHSLLRYVAIYSDWKPHVVLVMHAFNDIFQASEGRLTSGTFRDDYGHFFGALGERVNPEDRLADGLTRFFRNNWLARTWYSDFREPIATPVRPNVDLLRALPSFQRNLDALHSRIVQDDGILVLLTQPYLYGEQMSSATRSALFYDFYYKDYATVPTWQQQRAAMDRFNDAIRTFAVSRKAPFVDLEAALPKSTELLYDDVHYTSDGAAEVASIIAGALPWSEWLRTAPTRGPTPPSHPTERVGE